MEKFFITVEGTVSEVTLAKINIVEIPTFGELIRVLNDKTRDVILQFEPDALNWLFSGQKVMDYEIIFVGDNFNEIPQSVKTLFQVIKSSEYLIGLNSQTDDLSHKDDEVINDEF